MISKVLVSLDKGDNLISSSILLLPSLIWRKSEHSLCPIRLNIRFEYSQFSTYIYSTFMVQQRLQEKLCIKK